MKKKRLVLKLSVLLILAGLMSTGCATYGMSKNIKMISYDEDASKGKTLGPVSGESCSWKVMGYSVSRAATLDEAFADIRTRTAGTRYLNNVSTDTQGFDAKIVAKECLVIKGVAYK